MRRIICSECGEQMWINGIHICEVPSSQKVTLGVSTDQRRFKSLSSSASNITTFEDLVEKIEEYTRKDFGELDTQAKVIFIRLYSEIEYLRNTGAIK